MDERRYREKERESDKERERAVLTGVLEGVDLHVHQRK